MYYFVLENDQLVRVEVETFPQELELLYQDVRKKYSIEYNRSDWADDDRDAGMGYCYSNSYHICREPKRGEMLLKDGQLAGFYVGYNEELRFKQALNPKYILKLENRANIYERGTYSNFYGNSKKWTLIVEDEPKPANSVFLEYVHEENRDREYVPEDFDAELIESIENVSTVEDNYGRFNQAFRVILKLTEKGIENPDQVLKVLAGYRPVLTKC